MNFSRLLVHTASNFFFRLFTLYETSRLGSWLTLFRKQTAANNNTSFILHIAREDTLYPLSYPYLYFYTLLFLIIPFPISCICGIFSTFYLLTFSFFYSVFSCVSSGLLAVYLHVNCKAALIIIIITIDNYILPIC